MENIQCNHQCDVYLPQTLIHSVCEIFFTPYPKKLASFSSCTPMNLTLEFPNTVVLNMPRGKDSSYIPLLLKQVALQFFFFFSKTNSKHRLSYYNLLFIHFTRKTIWLLPMTKRGISYLDSLNFVCRKHP